MGGKSSKGDSRRSNSWNWGRNDYPQSPYAQGSQSYQQPQTTYPSYPPTSQPYEQPSQNYAAQFNQPQKMLDRRYSRIADNYSSLEQVTEALARAGLESSNLIVGIDFTKSNEWTGARSYNRRSLHHIGDSLNPYEQAISIIGKTLAAFDEDNLIPCYGFGDASTHDQDVFSFFPEERFCNGFEEVLSRYREIIPQLRLAGPTSFAPVIEMATTIVQQSGGQYHVLLIIADGQVTRSVDTEGGRLSPQEQKTVDAIVAASKFPLSIILVGVGDGPWDMMKEFDDNIPSRDFDNFQFVNFTEIMAKNVPQLRKETEFALSALMEIPSQYKATIELNILGGQKGNSHERIALPPPVYGAPSFGSSKPSRAASFQQSSSSHYSYNTPDNSTAPPDSSSASENQVDIQETEYGSGRLLYSQDISSMPSNLELTHDSRNISDLGYNGVYRPVIEAGTSSRSSHYKEHVPNTYFEGVDEPIRQLPEILSRSNNIPDEDDDEFEEEEFLEIDHESENDGKDDQTVRLEKPSHDNEPEPKPNNENYNF